MDYGYVYKITFSGKVYWDGSGWSSGYRYTLLMNYSDYMTNWSAIQRTIIKFESVNNFL